MKHIIIYGIIFISICALCIKAQNKIEGEIKYIVKYEGENIQLNLFLSSSNMRMDKINSTGSESYHFANGISVVLYPSQMIYTEYKDIKDAFLTEMPPLFEGGKDELKLIKTGVKERLLGIECEKWILKNQLTSIEMWVTNEIYQNNDLLETFPKYFIDWQVTLKKERVFPLVVNIKDELGNTIYSCELYSVDRNPPDKGIFIVPGNYTKSEKKRSE